MAKTLHSLEFYNKFISISTITMKNKLRLDALLVEKNLVDSKSLAQRLILAGKVLVNNKPVTKKGALVDINSELRLKEKSKYVSRGGEKLEIAVKKFKLDFKDKTVLDIGISTGGFTDCALKNGAASVTGVDVGYGQTAWSIRNNSKVKLIEKQNARYLNLGIYFDIIMCDVSFISVEKLIDVFVKHLKENSVLIILVKPQFEAEKHEIDKGGIVKNINIHFRLLNKLYSTFKSKKLYLSDIAVSDILYPKGNIEYLTSFSLNPELDINLISNILQEFSEFETHRGVFLV